LIDEIFDKLPPHVWKDPKLKWLDPANGVGNFPMKAYEKLLKELPDKYTGANAKESYSTEEGKKKYIITHMLYMVEINPRNVKIAKKIFGNNANICCADFLSDDQRDKCFIDFGVNKFNIIIGNPPFNVEVGEKRFGSGRTLWDKFVIKSLDLLHINGYLCFIHPQNWRGLGLLHNIYELLTSKKILYLHIYSETSGKKLFNVSQSFDLYVLQNKINEDYKTNIIDENDKEYIIDIHKIPFLPNSNINKIIKILTTIDKGINVNYGTQYHTTKSYVKPVKNTEYKYLVANNINSDGIQFLYTNDNTKNFFGMPKVIVSVGRYPFPYNDYKGEYGLSQGGFGIPISSKKQGDDIVKAINSDEFQDILKSTKWGAFQIDYRMFKYFKPDFYKYFLNSKISSKKSTTVKYESADKPKKSTAKKTQKYHSVGGSKTRK
jgi:hypothetical protein